jgi:hypothetical protein
MSVSAFNLRLAFHNGVKHIYVNGAIDEHARLPKVTAEEKLVIDFGGTLRLNSTGTRTWCLWMRAIPEDADVEFKNCPVILVKSFTTIQGFLKPFIKIHSFAVPYYSKTTNERSDFMLIRDQHFGDDLGLSLPELKDSRGGVMQVDVNPQTYFGFLARRPA